MLVQLNSQLVQVGAMIAVKTSSQKLERTEDKLIVTDAPVERTHPAMLIIQEFFVFSPLARVTTPP